MFKSNLQLIFGMPKCKKDKKKLQEYINCNREYFMHVDSGTAYAISALLRYHSEYPLYSQMALMNINIDFEGTEFLREERETFQVGEKINELLGTFFREGI